jgi:uncharacterized protein with ParB-like and HNH nuclease domain
MRSQDRDIMNKILRVDSEIKIPVYQRNYDWTEKQCKKLINDLKMVIDNTQYYHYFGSIIIKGGYGKDNFPFSYIVDGQQRITTIFLMLKALIFNEANHNFVNEINNTIYLRAESHNKKLSLNIEDDIQLAKIFNNDEGLDNNSNVVKNFLWFRTYFSNMPIHEKNLYFNAFERFVFVEIMIEERDDAQLIFENINSTGVPLSASDLIRNYLLLSPENQEVLYRKYWYEAEKMIGFDKMDSFLNHFVTFYKNEKVNSNMTYQVFKSDVCSEEAKKEVMLSSILKLSHIYGYLIGKNEFKDKNVNDMLSEIRMFNQTTVYPFLMHILEDYGDNTLSLLQLQKIVTLIRNYLLRKTFLNHSKKNFNRFFASMYDRIFKDAENRDNYYDSIASYLFYNGTEDEYPTDNVFEKNLPISKLYDKSVKTDVLTKFLYNLEAFNAKEFAMIEKIQIEHIMPQTLTKQWEKELGPEYLLVHHDWLHTLGNLTLTGYNPELSNKSFAEKRNIIEKSNTKFNWLFSDIVQSDCWNEETIRNRAVRLTSRALEVYSSEAPTQLKTFENWNRYNLNDYDNLSKTKIEQFEFNGKVYRVQHYTEMLSEALKAVYDLKNYKLEQLAKINYKMKNGKAVDISLDANLIGRGKKIENTNIYYNCNLDANDIVKLIGEVFEYAEIDKSEFNFLISRENYNSKNKN